MSGNPKPEGRENPQAEGTSGTRSGSSEQWLNLRQSLPIGAFWIVVAVIVLVSLPLGALLVTQGSDCCHPDTLPDLITFWGAVLAGMLALFGLLISGIYIFTAFKIDTGAKTEAREAATKTAKKTAPKEARKAAGKFYEKYRKNELKKLRDVVEEITERARERSESVNEILDKAERETKEALALAESSKSDMEKGVAEFSRAAAEGREEMSSEASRIRDLAIASETNINNAVDEVKRTAQNSAVMQSIRCGCKRWVLPALPA